MPLSGRYAVAVTAAPVAAVRASPSCMAKSLQEVRTPRPHAFLPVPVYRYRHAGTGAGTGEIYGTAAWNYRRARSCRFLR